jgi:hypothetical protein
MNRKQRRSQRNYTNHFKSREACVDAIVDHCLEGANDCNVVVGPLCWRPTDGTSSRYWYFIVATSEKARGFRCDQVQGDEEDRMAVLLSLATRRPPLIIHVMDNEVDMARWCELLWPGKRISRLRKQVEAETAEISH